MLKEQWFPLLAKQQPEAQGEVKRFYTFGLSESSLSDRLDGFALPEGARLGYRSARPCIEVKVFYPCPEPQFTALIDSLRQQLGEHVFSEDQADWALHLQQLMIAQNKKLVLAESCTGGGIAFAFTSASGSSDWFNQSWVTYSNDAKHTCLNVKEATLTTHGAVSQETVAEMATGAKDKSQANLVVTVSGIAGPGGGSADKPVGTVWFGFICGEKKQEIKKLFSGGRDAVRAQAVRFAIAQLLTMISE